MSSRREAYHRLMPKLRRLHRRRRVQRGPWGFDTPDARAALRRHQNAPSYLAGVRAGGFRKVTEAEFKRLFGHLAGDGDQQHPSRR